VNSAFTKEYEETRNYYFTSYAEQAAKGLNYLIFRKSYPDATRTYYSQDRERKYEVTSNGVYLIYFDLKKKKIVGHDIIRGRTDFPTHIDLNWSSTTISLSSDTVKEKIKARIRD
jgi:hypothetical protein